MKILLIIFINEERTDHRGGCEKSLWAQIQSCVLPCQRMAPVHSLYRDFRGENFISEFVVGPCPLLHIGGGAKAQLREA